MTVVLISNLGKKGAGNFHLVLEDDVKGGYRTVETIAQRDAIPEWARKPGMKVSVIEENFAEYKLGVDTTIAGQVWTLVDRASDALTQDDLGETVVPLDGDKKIDPVYLPNIFLNTVYSVETIPEMLALTTFTGNAVIVADTGDGNAATYFKTNNNSPSVIGDFIQILFPGSVVSVNGMTGAVTITLQGLLSISENLTAFNNAVLNSPAVTNINTTLGGHTNSINDLNQAISDIINQLDELIGQIHGSGIVLYEDKEWEAGKYVEYENEGVNGIYRSIQNVPSGIPPSDTDYWVLVSGQIQSANSDEATTGQENKKYLTPKTNLDALINWLGTGLSWNSVGKKINSLFTQNLKDKLDGIQAGATKNDNTDELSEGTTNKYFTEARAVTAKIAGYVKAGSSVPLEEADSILQALGKLEKGLDAKLSIEGDNFIATRPTANKAENGVQLQNIIYSLEGFTPGGQPLSNTNRVHVLVFPGEYNQNTLYLNSPYVDIIGFGSKNGIILNGNIDAYGNEDHRIENLTIVGGVSCYSHTEVCVYRNLTVGAFFCNTLGTFENIEHIDIGGEGYLFETLDGGILKNIYTPQALGSYVSLDFKGIIEDCRVEAQRESIGVSGVITRSYFRGFNDEAIIELRDGAEISYSTVINDSNASYNLVWAVTNYKRFGAPDTDTYVKIHHCHFVAKDGALNPKVINTITNGHNTWDVEGTGDGIEDIIAGTNISIDKTDPKKPIINFTGEELGAGMFAPVQNLTVLRAIDTTDTDIYKDKWLIHVEDAGLYRFDREGTGVDDGNQIITPTVGGGRWFKMSSSITSHEMLTGIQGGTTGEHYHLTAAEYLKLSEIAEGATKNENTDELVEGSNNKYFTEARVRATKITGYEKASAFTALEENDSILEVFGKLEKGVEKANEDISNLSTGLKTGSATIEGGVLDFSDLDIINIVLSENTTINTIDNASAGGVVLSIQPDGYTLDWSSSLINPLNISGSFDKDEDMLAYILVTSVSPLRFKVTYEINHAPVIPPPVAPSELMVTAINSGRIDLSWTDNSDDESGFQIERSIDNVSFSLLEEVGAGVTSFQDESVDPETTYYYRVRAVNENGSSTYTSTESATTPEIEEVWYRINLGGASDPAMPNNFTGSRMMGSRLDDLVEDGGFVSTYAIETTATFGTILNGNPCYTTGDNSGAESDLTLVTAIGSISDSVESQLRLEGFNNGDTVEIEVISCHVSSSGNILYGLNGGAKTQYSGYQSINYISLGTATADASGYVTIDVIKPLGQSAQAITNAIRFRVL